MKGKLNKKYCLGNKGKEKRKHRGRRGMRRRYEMKDKMRRNNLTGIAMVGTELKQ